MEPIGKLNAAIYRNLQSIINHKLNGIPILSGQCDFFFVISQNEGISQKQLSQHMFVNKSTTAKAVKNLIKEGLVKKNKDKDDKRLEHLYLTPAGRAIAPQIERMFEENIAIAASNLSVEETSQLANILRKVLQNLIDEKHKITGDSND